MAGSYGGDKGEQMKKDGRLSIRMNKFLIQLLKDNAAMFELSLHDYIFWRCSLVKMNIKPTGLNVKTGYGKFMRKIIREFLKKEA